MNDETPTPEARYRAAAGIVVRRLRTEAGWSLREFAEQVGVAHTSLHAVERGETTPTIDTLARIAESRDLTLRSILALIVDAIDTESATDQGGLSRLLSASSSLNDDQIDDVVGFVAYVRYRDRQT